MGRAGATIAADEFDIGRLTDRLVEMYRELAVPMTAIRSALSHGAVLPAFFAFAVTLQVMSGAYAADFAGNPDEPTHYVTGVMVRDYLATFPWQAPMPFARNFYETLSSRRNRTLAPGVLSPCRSIWTLPFGVSRMSVLLLMALLSAATATVAFASVAAALWRGCGRRAGAGVSVGANRPGVRAHGDGRNADRAVHAVAVAAYRRYLDTESWRDSLLFGLLASAAILTKPNGLALALVPMLAVLVTRRWTLLKTFPFWLPALVVVLVCAPWYVFTAGLAQEGWSASYDPSWLLREPATVNALHLIRIAGAPLFALAIIGATVELWPRWHRRVDHLSVVMASLLCSVWLFHSFVVPVRDARHLIPAIPAMLSLSAAALAALARFLTSFSWAPRHVVTAFGVTTAVALLLAGVGNTDVRTGAEAAVHEVLARTGSTDVVLVSSEGYGEGVFIAEMAEHEQRPGHRVVRASKVLVELDVGSVRLPSATRHRSRCRPISQSRGDYRGGCRFDVTGVPCPSAPSPATSRCSTDVEPLDACLAGREWSAIRRVSSPDIKYPVAFASCDSATSAAILNAPIETPALNGIVNRPA